MELQQVDVINIFLNEVRLKGGLPFEMKLPGETLKVIKDAREYKNMIEMDIKKFKELVHTMKFLKDESVFKRSL